MAGRYQHLKRYSQWLGIDLRSSKETRRAGFAEDAKNVGVGEYGALTTRFGTKLVQKDGGRFGMVLFETTDLTGTSKTELIGYSIGSSDKYKLGKLTKYLVRVRNDNASAATLYLFYDEASSQFRFQAYIGGSAVIDQALGVGTEGSPYMMSSLSSTINAHASFTVTSGPTDPAAGVSQPAAFAEQINGITIALNATKDIEYWVWSALTYEVGVNDGIVDRIGSEACRNASMAVLNRVLYLAQPSSTGGTDHPLLKYDGQSVFRAGLPPPGIDAAGGTSEVASPASPSYDTRGYVTRTRAANTARNYICRYVSIDKAGNRVEGPIFRGIDPAVAGNKIAVIALEDGTPFDDLGYRSGHALGGLVDQTGLTFSSVMSPITLRVGDVAFFWDNGQGRYIQRLVTAIPSTTSFTLSTDSLDQDPLSPNYDAGGNVTIKGNALITNNQRIAFYGTIGGASGTVYYFIEEVPNWNVQDFFTYEFLDTATDADIEARGALLEDKYPHDEPPLSCSMIASYNGGLILSGNRKKPSTVFFSDSDGPEYFPRGTHEFDAETAVTGIRQTGEILAIGQARQIEVTSGILSDFNFRVDKVVGAVGVAAHHSMQEIEEGIMAFESYVGPYMLIGGRRLEPLGALTASDGSKSSRIQPYWTKYYDPTAEKPCFERATSVLMPEDKLYILFVPHEDPTKPGFATANSVAWVFDYGRGAWWKWEGLNMAGGMLVYQREVYFGSRSHDGNSGILFANIVSRTSQQQRRHGAYNYADHATAITSQYKSHHEHLGQPGMLKRFLRILLLSLETRPSTVMRVALKTFLDFKTDQANNDTVTFSSATMPRLKAKLKGETCHAQQLVLESSDYHRALVLSGYELEAVANFRQELKE